MDTPEVPQSRPEETKMELNRDSMVSLHETGGWANFLAILGFIMVGFLVIMAFVMNFVFSNLPMGDSPIPAAGGIFTVVYLLIAVVYFFPVLYLYRFANGVREGIRARDSQKVADGLRNLKSHYKFVGILTIAGFVLYILFIILFVALGAGKMLGNSVNA